ncbi:MAG: pilus assembly protein PilM [Lentisphaeria bacterium]|nr:pilus assembly protein PilM [Lentisphaeria bacterium]
MIDIKSWFGALSGETGVVTGLDVGQNAVKAVTFTRGKGGVIQATARRLSREAEGILDEADLFSHLPAWLASVDGGGGETVVGIPQHFTTVQISSFPKEAAKGMDGMVAFQTRQLADLSDESFVHDYCVMASDDGKELPVLIGICLEALIQERMEKYSAANIRVVDFSISSLAMTSAFLHLHPDSAHDGKVHLLLDIGTENTTMVAVRNGRVHFCGSLDFGGERYQAAMAETNKRDGRDDRRGIRGPARRTHIRTRDQESALGQVAQMLVAEIRSGIEYWQEQHEDDDLAAGEPDCLFLCGGGASLPGLLDFLERSLTCSVHLLEVPDLGDDHHGGEFVVAYGLALQAARRSPLTLSLAPASLKWHARREKRSNVLICVAALLFVALLSLFMYEWRHLNDQHLRLDRDLKTVRKYASVITDLEKASETLVGLETVQLPVIEHGNRALRFARALERLSNLKGPRDWFVYFGDRQAFDAGKADTVPLQPSTKSVKTVPNPFAVEIYTQSPEDGKVQGPRFPVAAETEPMRDMVAAGYTLLVKNDPYGSVRLMKDKLNDDPLFTDVDVLPASEASGREDIFSAWSDYIERERRQRGLSHDLRRFSLQLSFAQTDITHAQKPEKKQ